MKVRIMKRELKRAIIGNVVGFGALVVFFTVLEVLTPISIAAVIVGLAPAMIAGIIGGFIGAYVSIRRKPDERMQLILKRSATNGFWVLLMVLPFVSVAFMFLPTQSGMIYGAWLFGVWAIGLAAFYLSAIYYYYA